MKPIEELTFSLVKHFALEFVPTRMQEDFDAGLKQAQQVLPDHPLLSDWIDKKSACLGIWQGVLESPRVPDDILSTVSDAVFYGQDLSIRYIGDTGEKYREVYPLALVNRDSVCYLVLRFFGYDDARLLPLHRIVDAIPTTASTKLDSSPFDLDDFLKVGLPFTPPGNPTFDVHLLFSESVHRTLSGRPLCNTLVMSEPVDGWFEVKATDVANTMALRWWLLGFGEKVRILEPQALAHELHCLHYDQLTSLIARRSCQEHFERMIAATKRTGKPLAVAMVDIDHFKAINDDLGHSAGDRALQEVSRRLKNTCRATDIVGRWGGEEFLILLPETNIAEAALLGDRLRDEITATPCCVDDHGTTLRVSVSIGITSTQALSPEQLRRDDQLDMLLKQADCALYKAKEKRNVTEVFVEGCFAQKTPSVRTRVRNGARVLNGRVPAHVIPVQS